MGAHCVNVIFVTVYVNSVNGDVVAQRERQQIANQHRKIRQLDVIFAGHTHGGQVRLPWFGGSKALTTNCDLPKWQARGATQKGKQSWLHVSAGMGTSPFARIRVASPPEVSVVTLTTGF